MYAPFVYNTVNNDAFSNLRFSLVLRYIYFVTYKQFITGDRVTLKLCKRGAASRIPKPLLIELLFITSRTNNAPPFPPPAALRHTNTVFLPFITRTFELWGIHSV